MSKKLFWFMGVLVLLAGFGYSVFQAKAKSQAVRYVTATTATGTVTATVSGTGNVVVDRSAKVNPSITGTVADVAVKVGDHVTKGQRLFTITNDQLDVTINKAYASFLQSQQALTNSQTQLLNAQTSDANQSQDSGQAKAQAALDQAKLQLAQAQVQLAQDQAMLAKDQDDNQKTPGTHPDSDINILTKRITADEAEVTANQSSVDSATISLAQAKNTASNATAVSKSQLSAAQQSVTIATKNVENAKADYDNQKQTAAGRIVTAPIDGTVTTLSVAAGDQIGSSNQSSATVTPVVAIEDLSSLKANLSLNEVDAGHVKVGQKVAMTFDAIDGLTLTGKVTKIDTVGTINQGVVSYGAVIDFDSLDPRVLPQMSVSATITTDVKQDVLTVPSTAIKVQGDGHFVQVLVNGVPHDQTVETGLASDTTTEITSGLHAGDSVVTQTITNQKSTTTTQAPGLGFGLGGGGGNFRRSTGTSGGGTRQAN